MGILDRLFGKGAPETFVVSAVVETVERTRPKAKDIDARDESALPENAVLLGMSGSLKVKGVSHYQDALDRICGGRCEQGHFRKCYATLHPEPENPYDENAIAVRIDGALVGYLARDLAPEYGPVVRILSEAGKIGVARALIRGGWDRGNGDEGHYGVKLDLSPPDVLLKSRKIKALQT